MAELKKILYVEDEPDIQMIARVALERMSAALNYVFVALVLKH